MGFEPTTFSLARRRTTTVLRPHLLAQRSAESAETQNRTVDTAIFSRVLYQLSYLGQIFCCYTVPPEEPNLRVNYGLQTHLKIWLLVI